MREAAFRLARHDVAEFLRDHEEELIAIFREEMETLDEQIPEESFFIDINMVGLGEVILKAALSGITRFLEDEALEKDSRVEINAQSEEESRTVTLKDSQQ
mgnify:CR=1 FL=1